jgi:hypothetical protein
VVVFLGAAVASPAIANPPSPADDLGEHFRCYSVALGYPPIPNSLILLDQFDDKANHIEDHETYWIGQPIGFCPPVEKTVYGPPGPDVTTSIDERDHHLTMYEIYQAFPRPHFIWNVTVDNQFGRQTLFAGKPVVLGVPTQKTMFQNDETDHDFPEELNHYKCYRAKGERLNVYATLRDEEFEWTNVFVREPVLFCNPTKKVLPGSAFPRDVLADIENEKAHLTCYNIDGADDVGISALYLVGLDNQLTDIVDPWSVVTDERLLCVPSVKRSVLGTPGSITAEPPRG